MSAYYNPRRRGNLYDPNSEFPFRLSRSKIDSFLNCQRCFYIDRRLGVGQPPGYPFSLNSAVDKLLKKEFDVLRLKKEAHPLMVKFGIDAIPFAHEKLNEWRDPFKGVTYALPGTNFVITGGVDDIWQNPSGELIIVDYKATSKEEEVSLDAEWQIGYKRQMEIYQWLFRMNNFKVAKTGYFVYCNGKTDGDGFDAKLEFDIKILPYAGDDSWVEKTVREAYECLRGNTIPQSSLDCDYCNYRRAVGEVEK